MKQIHIAKRRPARSAGGTSRRRSTHATLTSSKPISLLAAVAHRTSAKDRADVGTTGADLGGGHNLPYGAPPPADRSRTKLCIR